MEGDGRKSPSNQLSKAHMNSQRWKEEAGDLHRSTHVLCAYIVDLSLLELLNFHGTLECVNQRVSDSWASYGLFSFC